MMGTWVNYTDPKESGCGAGTTQAAPSSDVVDIGQSALGDLLGVVLEEGHAPHTVTSTRSSLKTKTLFHGRIFSNYLFQN
jgi:hypothetical protein